MATETIDTQQAIERIEEAFTSVMGPLAYLILRERLVQCAASASQFPINKMAEFIEQLSLEVYDESARAAFQQQALRELERCDAALRDGGQS